MTELSRTALFGRLDQVALKSIQTALEFCKQRHNPYVELAHWVHVLLQDAHNDVGAIRAFYGLNEAQLAGDMVKTLGALPGGATAVTDFSPQIMESIEQGWIYASLMFDATKIRTGHLLVGMLKTPTLRSALYGTSGEWRKVSADKLSEDFTRACVGSSEAASAAAELPLSPDGQGSAQGGPSEALDKFSVDLTDRARRGEIDRIVGRDAEIRQVIDILLRRRQNNPILTGEAGVGKTAVAEGFARRIVDSGDVPPPLKDVTLRALDTGLLQAGASVQKVNLNEVAFGAGHRGSGILSATHHPFYR